MKIKKILAALLATTLISSTFVAYAHDFATRKPVITYDVGEKITTKEGLEAITTTAVKYVSGYDYYPISIKLKDLGNLYINEDATYRVLNDITFTFKTDAFKAKSGFSKLSNGVSPDGTWSAAQDNVNTEYFNVYWEPTKSGLTETNIYPGDFTNIENASLDFTIILALTANTELTLNNSSLGSCITLFDSESGETVAITTATIANDSLVFGKTVDPDPKPTVTPWEVTITKDTENAKGYIWKVDTAKGDGNLTKFDVTFKDAASNELTRSIIASDKGGALDWNAATSFYVGLYTTRTGVTADWDVASKDGDTVIPATIK